MVLPNIAVGGKDICFEEPLMMGILNATPDSFSDGAADLSVESLLRHAHGLAAAGAAIVDVGGESTRPGACPVPTAVEMDRVIPVIRALTGTDFRPHVSVDTSKSSVARAALTAGATIVNDVTACGDPAMAATVASHQAVLVLMHMRGNPRTMQTSPTYSNVVAEVVDALCERALYAAAEGVCPQHIWLDPGMGFGKTVRHNLSLLHDLQKLVDCGYPVVFGASRKNFLGRITGEDNPRDRDMATAGACAAAVLHGALVLRVHNVMAIRPAVQVAAAVKRQGRRSESLVATGQWDNIL